MPKVWNIGNTTVRNPKRIESALHVFLEEGFSGNVKGAERETKLHEKLKEREILEFDGSPSDLNGRKWRAAFYQLGFVSNDGYKLNGKSASVKELFEKIGVADVARPYEITPSGLKLIRATRLPEIEEIYLRQFACYELPTSLEPDFRDGRMKPFILFVQVLLELIKDGHAGLSKIETGLFIQKFRDHTPTLAKEIAEEVLGFRSTMTSVKTPKEQKDLRDKYVDELGVFAGIKPNSVIGDYSDTTFRYFTLSGLFTRIGETITIRSNKLELAKALVSDEPNFRYATDPLKYFELFYTNTYPLPSDSKDFALREISKVTERIRDPESLLIAAISEINTSSSITDITEARYKIIEYDNWQREDEFAKAQSSPESISEILSYLKALDDQKIKTPREIDDKPAFLEWALWRSFLAINEIVVKAHECRRFQIDEDFFPRNTAPGGGADMIFEFENYVLVVEVTMTISHRQMAVESEPVRRHVVRHKESYPNKDVYCLFVAPEVDNNVMESFRIGVWYNNDKEEFVNIIPMSLSNFIEVFETALPRRFSNVEFLKLLDRCLALRNARAPIWKSAISDEIKKWHSRFNSHA